MEGQHIFVTTLVYTATARLPHSCQDVHVLLIRSTQDEGSNLD